MARSIAPLQLAGRAAVAAAASIAVARALELPFPIYAMIAAVIVTDLSPARTRELSLQRVAGTVLGAVLGALLAHAGGAIWTIAGGVFVAMLACHAGRMPEAAKLAGYVSAIVLIDHAAEPWLYATLRLAETLVGIALAVLLSVVPKLLSGGEAPPAG